ncbi:hypothetical protein AK830_g8083 [Neonectria ditissima]|uniref:Uncharacterized protein n=1 Tax=Neonectria ditissima TaxID=78410 RepID=A0A0P7AYA1_9HYPO|nr:hypothetical protein AK830_g8083 [Neonectria ditissima]
MSHADTQNTSDPGADVSSAKPSWLTYINQRIEEEEEIWEDTAHYQIVRDLLLAPDDDDDAVSKAAKKFRDNYVAGFAKYPVEERQAPEYLAGEEVNSISDIVFEVVPFVPFTDITHDKLANLLIEIKASAAGSFDTENPQFVYYNWGFEAAANDSWKHNHANGWIPEHQEPEAAKQACESWLNRAALIAKLFKAGMLDSEGPPWTWHDFESAFETATHGEVATNIGRQAQILATANYIILAGESVVKDVKAPSKTWQAGATPEKWKLWASKLEEAANTVGEDAAWEFKNRTQKAHDMMVELFPEAFKEDA